MFLIAKKKCVLKMGERINDYLRRCRSIIFKVPQELNYGISFITLLIAEIMKGENGQQFCA